MLVPKKIKGPKRTIFYVIIVFSFVVVAILLVVTLTPKKRVKINLGAVQVDKLEVETLDTSFQVDFLNKPPYTKLEQHGKLPVEAERTGRLNPFSKIPFYLLEQ